MLLRLSLALLAFALAAAADWKAGVAAVPITPLEPVWMSGYGSRDVPSKGVAQDLWAKALALEGPAGRRAVIVTTDLIGLSRPVAELIASRAFDSYRLSRDRLVLTSSHTHTGPAVSHNIPLMQAQDPELRARTDRYTQWMAERVVLAIGKALDDLTPATLTYHLGEAHFAMNRRVLKPDGGVSFGESPDAPVDNDVPVLQVVGENGELRAALFSYAAHNTTLTGSHFEIHGDYAGFAQAMFQKDHPGAVALYMMGCGADANPSPRGEMENAERNGRELADAVAKALDSSGTALSGPMRSSFRRIPLKLEPPADRAEWEKRAGGDDKWQRLLGERFLGILNRQGSIPDTYEYPIHVLKLGEQVTLVALGGEVVVDYGHKLEAALGAERTWMVGYASDVMGYIPSVRILNEGGYEAEFSQTYYGMPGRWDRSIEQTILDAVIEDAR